VKEIVLLVHNIRSTHNVGSLFRTAEGFGVTHIYISGYTPYPILKNDTRLPHISQKLTKQIRKTALGAEQLVPFSYQKEPPIDVLKQAGFRIVGLEQYKQSIRLDSYKAPEKVAVLIGEEVDGIAADLINICDDIIEIPMIGKKESFNVSVATGIALYHLRYRS
jgi:tRNA G18 (ribose-2'-O)-methylase SpoU